LYSSVQDKTVGLEPPNTTPAFVVPAPPGFLLAVIKAVIDVQAIPLYDSTHEKTVGALPIHPAPKAAF